MTSDLLISSYERHPASGCHLLASILSRTRSQFLSTPHGNLQRAFDSSTCFEDSLVLQFTDKILSRQLPDQPVHFQFQERRQNSRMRMGLAQARQLLAPSLALGWAWRLWVYLATLFAAAVPFFKTHFFDPTRGNIPQRLAGALASTVLEGLIAGLLVWGIAVWIARATQPESTLSPRDT
jgi:hypothetical protein